MAAELSKQTGTVVPPQLASLKEKKVRFDNVCDIPDMEQQVYDLLHI